ncbi:MAG TPA: hypothetical protein VG713_09445 [Pirellulales bacterium]|jgi:hypothetical protein|nr:hypothetical protein [Pirellulales bacterium]
MTCARAAAYLSALVGCLCLGSVLWAQRPGFNQGNRGTYRGPNGGGGPQQADKKGEDEYKLPDDKRLLEIHKKFVVDAEKLALDYEREKKLDKARVCYEEILRLVPTYAAAQTALDRVKGAQYSAEKKQLDIMANKGWQDTGVVVSEGLPIHIRADGSWTFRMTHEVSGDGMEVPEELQEFKLGSLVGMVDDGTNSKDNKPFLVGSQYEFTAEKTGKLLLRMYDSDPSDNMGKLNVTIAGTFFHPKK